MGVFVLVSFICHRACALFGSRHKCKSIFVSFWHASINYYLPESASTQPPFLDRISHFPIRKCVCDTVDSIALNWLENTQRETESFTGEDSLNTKRKSYTFDESIPWKKIYSREK